MGGQTRTEAKVGVKCLMKDWRWGDECLRIKDKTSNEDKDELLPITAWGGGGGGARIRGVHLLKLQIVNFSGCAN